MFGNVLSRLFSKGGSNAVSRVASQYGDDIARNLATNYGDDVARGTLSQVGRSLAEPTVTSAATKAATKSRIGDALVKASDTGLNAPLSLTRKGMREVGPEAGSKVGMLYDRTGMSTVDDLRKLGKELTGGDKSFLDEVTSAVRTNMGRGNNVDLSDLQPQIRTIRDSMDKTIRSAFDEKDPISLANHLRSAAADIRRSATPKAGDKLKANMLDDLGREINKRIDAGIDPRFVNQAFDDTADEFLTRSREALLRGDKKMSTAYKRLAKELSETPAEQRTVDSYRTFKKDFVDIDKMGKLSDQATGGGAFSRTVNQVPVVGPLADSLLSQPVEAGAQKAGEVMRKTGRAFQSGQAQDMLKKGAMIGGGGLVLANLMGGGGGEPQGMPQGAGMGVDPMAAGMTDPSQLSSLGAALGTQQMGGGMQPMQQPQEEEMTVAGYSRSQLEEAYVAALMDNNLEAADAIASMMDIITANEDRAADATGKTDEGAAKRAAGLRTLNTLLGSYERGGGGQGIIGGTLTNLLNTATGGAYNSSAQTYSTQARGAAAQIIKSLGESGQLSDRDIQAAMDMLPRNTDTEAVAREKISNLMTLLGE